MTSTADDLTIPRTATELAEALNARRSGNGWQARCLAHDDQDPSMSIGEGDDGAILVHCHAGCEQEAVLDALRARGLWPERREGDARPRPARPAKPAPPAGTDTPPPSEYPGRGTPDARWTYCDRDGRPVAAVYRFDHKDGGKEVVPMHWDGSAWTPKAHPTPRPLYRLDELAAHPEAPVVVTEGEKDADAAARLLPGVIATTSAGGSGVARHADWNPLAGRRVLVWPDADQEFEGKGRKYAEEVTRLAWEVGTESVSVLDPFAAFDHPEERVDGWGAADAEAEGWSRGDVSERISQNSQVSQGAAHWPEAVPLRRPPATGKVYPLEDLGGVIGEAARTVEEIVQAPGSLCGSSFLGAAALAAQGLRDVALPHGETKPLSLYLMSVGESGERKSAVDQHALAPIRKHERDERTEYEAQHQTYELDQEAYAKARENTLKQAKGAGRDAIREALVEAGCAEPAQPPVHPRHLLEDMTVEGIYRHYETGQPSAGLFSDEGGLFVGGHGMLPEHILKTITRLSKLWDGAPFDRARGGDGVATLYGRRMSLSLLMQGQVAARLLGEGIAENQGFLPRCLIAWPESRQGTRQYRTDNPIDTPAMQRYFARLKELMETDQLTVEGRPQELDPTPLPLSDEAATLYAGLHDRLETQLGPHGELAPVRASTAKTPEHAARIAGVLAVVEQGPKVAAIDAETFRRAMRIATFYLNERLRLVDAEVVPEPIRRAEALLRWLRDEGRQHIYSARIVQYGPREAGRSAKEVQEAMTTLAEHGWVRPIEGGMTLDDAHRRHVWEVRPDVLDG